MRSPTRVLPIQDYYPWQEGIYDPVPVVHDGTAAIPDGPGWGIEVRESWLAGCEYRLSELDRFPL